MEKMMDEVCGYINNFFVMKPSGKHRGTFTVEGGSLSVDFLQDGQYFRVVGSVFNDGVYLYPASDMVDESFTGEVWAMAVPPAVIALCLEIQTWDDKYGGVNSVNMSPFSSESFNNYSYSKATSNRGDGASSSSSVGWRDVFGNRLTRWRKL